MQFGVGTGGGNPTYAVASDGFDDGLWHYVAATLDTSGLRFYVDASLVDTVTSINSNTAATYNSGDNYVWVGAATKVRQGIGRGTRFYGGLVDEVRLTNVALNSSQITQNYQLGLAGHAMGAPQVDVSTQAGVDDTWLRLPGGSISLTGSDGTLLDRGAMV